MPSLGDLLYAFAQWLKHTPLLQFAVWVSKTKLNALVDSNIWIAPVVQTIHILAIAATFGSVLMVCLRVLELGGTNRTMAQTAARYIPWVWWGLAVLLFTGLILIIGEPPRELLNPDFWTKMGLILVAIGVGLAFQTSVRRHGDRWERSAHGTLALKTAAGAVIGLWCVIIVLGRWIAYAAT